jgi:hypothetical protein
LQAFPKGELTGQTKGDMKDKNRGVAQSGSVPEWGSGGRWFKSSRPDQTSLQLSGIISLLRNGEAFFLVIPHHFPSIPIPSSISSSRDLKASQAPGGD